MPPPSLFQRALSYYHARSAWLGEGGQPVSFALSYSRAVTCSTCPLNVQRPLYEALAEPVAALLRRQIEVKAKLQLVTPLDEQLHVCNACGCVLTLKVHAPLEHARGTLDPDELPAHCWIRTESAAPPAPSTPPPVPTP